MSARRTLISLVMLVVVSILLTAYLVVGVLHLHPFTRYHHVSVELSTSRGLQPDSAVLYNGIAVGKVTTISAGAAGLRADLQIDPQAQIPADAQIRVANLSMVGEQYIEFSSTRATGPYIADGAELSDHVDPGVSVADMLTTMRGLTGQFDPDTLNELARTITEGWRGRDADLAVIGDFSARAARTIGTYRSEFAGVLDHAQQLLVRLNGDRIGAVMRATAPNLAHMNVPFATLWSLLPGLAQATEGATGWYDVIIPFTQKIGDYLATILPDAAAILGVLQPTLNAVAPAGRVNLATLVGQGLAIVDENGTLRLTVAGPR
jgi:virulence factor Mce-like protein